MYSSNTNSPMKTFFHTFCCFLLAVVLAVIAHTIGISAQTFTLTVQNGYGSGTYKAGDSVFVWANPNPRGTVFDKWTGSTETMRYPLEYRSTLIMPARNTSIQATYRSAPVWTAASGTRMGTEFYYYAPPNYKGVVTFFHGAGGNARGWVDTNNAESRNFAEYAVAAGYAVLATESQNRTNKTWVVNTATNNPDFNNVFAIFDDLVSQGVFKRTDKLFGVGMSQGSGFTSIITAANPTRYAAAALYCVPGQAQAIAVTTVPSMWCMARNDTSEVFTRVADAKANYDVLVRRGIPTEFNVNEGSPVFPLRFWRILGIDSAGSRVAYNSFKAEGLLDARDFLTIDPRVSDVWKQVIPQQYRQLQGGFEDQLFAAFAQHKFYSDLNNKTITFFNRQRSMTNVVETVLNAVKIFPNPASNLVFVQGMEGASMITLTNVLGQTVMTLSDGQLPTLLNVSSLPSGIYVLRMQAQNKYFTQTIQVIR
jgi:dienelactone hydrolase